MTNQPHLVTLLSSGYEVQYVALRNILLIIQRRPAVLKNQVKVFFCKYNDPIYVKLAKLEIIYRLANEHNFEQVLAELAEYVGFSLLLVSSSDLAFTMELMDYKWLQGMPPRSMSILYAKQSGQSAD